MKTKGYKKLYINILKETDKTDKTTALKQIPVYNLLTDEQKEYVSKRSDIQRFPKGETISGLITSCLGLFLIL